MTKFLAYCRKIDAVVFAFQRWILITLCVAVTAINIAQISGRYIFFYSIPWSEQLSVALFIIIIFFGQNIATKNDNEIRIDLFQLRNNDVKKAMLVLSDLLCLIAVSVLFVSSIMLVQNALRFQQVISSMNLPYFYIFSIIPVGFALIFFSRLGVLLRRFFQETESASPSDGE